MRRAVRAEQNGDPAHALAAVDADLDAAAIVRVRYDRGDPVIEEPDVLDRFERLNEPVASVQGDRLKVRLEDAEVLRRERTQKEVANGGSGRLKQHGSHPQRGRAGAHGLSAACAGKKLQAMN